jgi:hypothetical protein
MLADELKLMLNTAGFSKTVRVVDWSQPRRVIRKDSTGTTILTISSQDTAENKGYNTTRYSVRIDTILDDPVNYPLNPKVKYSSQVILSLPTRADVTNGTFDKQLAYLFNLFVVGEGQTDGDGKIDAGDMATFLTRLVSGEA